jgi:hypothetical protein
VFSFPALSKNKRAMWRMCVNKLYQDKRIKSLKALSDGLLGLHYLQKLDFKTS